MMGVPFDERCQVSGVKAGTLTPALSQRERE
jgi:hypothetical protein